MKLRRLIQAVVGTPWAIMPEKLQAIVDVLEFQASGGQLSLSEIRARVGDPKTAPMSGAGIAVLPLYGLIGHKMNAVQDVSGPGGTSTEQFATAFDNALNDAAIGGIVIDVDSPGGTVPGTPELARKIYEARGTKPVVAIASSLAASAAYWIASAADEFWILPSGDVGSIGVYAMHVNWAAANEAAGIEPTYISAGKYKVEGNPDSPLDEIARQAMQDRVDSFYEDFTKAVATYRDVDQDQVINGFGEGRIVRAKPAVKLGMVDKIGTLDELLVRLGAGKPAKRSSRATATLAVPPLAASAGAISYTDLFVFNALERIERALAPSDSPADVAAAPTVVPVHGPPGRSAKELKMTEEEKAALVAAQAAEKAAEKARVDGLLALGEEYEIGMKTVRGWIDGKTTVESAQAEILKGIREKAKAAPSLVATEVRVLEGREQGSAAGPYLKGRRGLGEQLQDIVVAGQPGGRINPRLLKVNEIQAAASGASTGVGSDAGFLVQVDNAVDLLKESYGEGSLAGRCSRTELSADADKLRVTYIDETSRATGSRWGGVQTYRRAEAETVDAKRPKLGQWELELQDMMGIAYLTDRVEKDAQAMGGVFSEAFRTEFAFLLDDEIFRGNGVGRCQGVVSAAHTIAVAKESGQANDTVVFENVNAMWDRIHPRSKARGEWFINVEVGSHLRKMAIGLGTAGAVVYMPPGGISGAPFATLFGRPINEIEVASAIGDVGDISFLDLSQYKLITKGGVEEEESIHVRFLYGENTLRWTTRVNGAPKLKAPITPYKGTNTVSSFVMLAAR